MAPGSIRLGTYAGIPVRAHWSMAIIAVWFGAVLSTDLGIVGGVVATVRAGQCQGLCVCLQWRCVRWS